MIGLPNIPQIAFRQSMIKLLRCTIFSGCESVVGQKPSTCSAPACLLFPAADILRGTIILDVLAGENQERAQTAKRVGV